ncbi:MAG: hypothetical protein ACYTHJ_16645 [Planctomycetota bacterium]|jgi:hypothetical protein
MIEIDGNTTVQDLLREHPRAFDILAGHGMCQSCRDDPPAVPLHHFAQKHCGGDLETLIAEIRGGCGS